MTVNSFLICLREFFFLTQNDDFAKAIAFAWRPFLPIFKVSHFSNIRCLLERFFHRNTICGVCLFVFDIFEGILFFD